MQELIDNICNEFEDYINLRFMKKDFVGNCKNLIWKDIATTYYYDNLKYKRDDLPVKFWEKPEYGLKLIFDEINLFNKSQDMYIIATNQITKFISLYDGNLWHDIDNKVEQKNLFTAIFKKFKIDIELFKFLNYVVKSELLIDINKPFRVKSKLLLENGTFNFNTMQLEQNSWENGLDFKLNFKYNKIQDKTFLESEFNKYLNSVLPDLSVQKSLQEYFAYIISNIDLKVEKVAFLIGSGSNGKSVLFDIVKSVLNQGMSTVSLSDLLKDNDSSSHLITKSLINYCSEIGNLSNYNVDLDRFKKLASGEPILIKLLYQDKFMVDNYSKIIVNGNTLPPIPENSNAWFRRFLIIPFEQTFSGFNKDMNLLNKILEDDGQNMFLNWIIRGYQRLKYRVNNLDECNDAWKNSQGYPFYYSKKIEDELNKYKVNYSSSYAFLKQTEISKNIEAIKDVYKKYLNYCSERFLKKQNLNKFIGALLEHGYKIDGEYIKNIKVNYKETLINFNTSNKNEEF